MQRQSSRGHSLYDRSESHSLLRTASRSSVSSEGLSGRSSVTGDRVVNKNVLSQATRKNRKKNEALKDYLPSITHLQLDNKQIVSIASPEEDRHLQYCVNLQVLYLHDNLLPSIAHLDFAKKLTHLYIQNNQLTSLDYVATLPSIEKVYADGNRIDKIDWSSVVSPNFSELHISNQKLGPSTPFIITASTAETLSMSLTVLMCENNRLSDVHVLGSLQMLETLSLAENFLSDVKDITRVCEGCVNLQKLDLRNNPVTKLRKYRDRVIVACKNLVTLDGKEVGNYERQFVVALSEKNSRISKRMTPRRPPKLNTNSGTATIPECATTPHAMLGALDETADEDNEQYPESENRQFSDTKTSILDMPKREGRKGSHQDLLQQPLDDNHSLSNNNNNSSNTAFSAASNRLKYKSFAAALAGGSSITGNTSSSSHMTNTNSTSTVAAFSNTMPLVDTHCEDDGFATNTGAVNATIDSAAASSRDRRRPHPNKMEHRYDDLGLLVEEKVKSPTDPKRTLGARQQVPLRTGVAAIDGPTGAQSATDLLSGTAGRRLRTGSADGKGMGGNAFRPFGASMTRSRLNSRGSGSMILDSGARRPVIEKKLSVLGLSPPEGRSRRVEGRRGEGAKGGNII